MSIHTTQSPQTIRDILKLESAIDPSERTILLAHVLRIDRSMLLAHPELPIPEKSVKKFLPLVSRRERGEPIAYLLGKKEFFGREFSVTSSTLIPRPETETLVDILLQEISTHTDRNILLLDIGTGSGNIAVTIQAEIEQQSSTNKHSTITCIALDRSARALALAKKNAEKHLVDRHIRFIRSDLLSALSDSFATSADTIFIAGNLPYLSTDRYTSCARDVREYEPKSALLAGKDGLNLYRTLLLQIQKKKDWEQKQLFAIFEIDPEQEFKMRDIIKKQLPNASVRFAKDLSETLRFAILERSSETTDAKGK